MKEQYLSKTPFLTFVYLSKCNINLPCIIENYKKRFLLTGLMYILHLWIITFEAESSELALATSAWSFTLSPSLPISIWDLVPLRSPSWTFVCQNLCEFNLLFRKDCLNNATWPQHCCAQFGRSSPLPCSETQGRSRNQSMSRTSWVDVDISIN